jgi:hypothetical protein
MTNIYVMDEKTGKIEMTCAYSVGPKQAMINYIMQYIKHNWNVWQYPEQIDGVRESTKAKDHFYYDDIRHGKIIASYPA